MEPHIQYCKTSDGVSIAYWTLGEGESLVLTPPLGWSNISLEWQIPRLRAWYEHLASRRMLVRYDFRGSGMSERDLEDFSLDANASDLEAVVSRLEAAQFDLVAFGGPAKQAIAYIAKHPGRVARLVLWGAIVTHRHVLGTADRVEAMLALAENDWELAAETFAHTEIGWSRGQQAHLWAAFMRASVSQMDFIRTWKQGLVDDVSSLLPRISAETLVLQSGDLYADHSKVLASNIPGARLVRLGPGRGVPTYEHEDGMRLVDEFLGIETLVAAPERSKRRDATSLVTILFTDLTSSTALTQRLGDAKAQELVRAHNTIVRDALSAHDGTEIKHTGDGIMASFTTASGALECAVAIQRAVDAKDDANLQVHVGLNAGEPVAEEQDLFGTAVQLARRICDHAESGQILASNVVRELSAGKGFLFADIGDVVPKGFDEAVRLYEVAWREGS
jgi:class 3 adenylate cyclase